MRHDPSVLLLLVALGVAGCGSPTASDREDRCRPTNFVANSGCATLVALPGSLPAGAPDDLRWDLRGDLPGTYRTEVSLHGTDPIPDTVTGRITRWDGPRRARRTDTATIPLVLRILDDSRPVEVGVPLPVFALDTVRRTIRFGGVGEAPPVNVVRFSLEPVGTE